MTIFTVDVSSHDGPVDWHAVAGAGIPAACIKATEGGGPGYRYTNPLFSAQARGAFDAGLPLVGAYHCLTNEDVPAQLGYFLSAIASVAGTAWAMLDVEPFEELAGRGLTPTFGVVRAFCDEWWNRTNHPLAVYLPKWVWEQMGSPPLTVLPRATVLVASNYPHPQLQPFEVAYRAAGGDDGPGWFPYGRRQPDLWQYTDRALVPGIRGGTAGCDVNAFRGDLATLTHLLTSAPTPTNSLTPQGDDMPTLSGEIPFQFAVDELGAWLPGGPLHTVPVPLPAVGEEEGQWGPAWLYLAGTDLVVVRFGCFPAGIWDSARVTLLGQKGPLPLPAGTELLLLARQRGENPASALTPARWHVQYGPKQ